MTRPLLYLSHPNVVIDPDVPVPQWPLSDQGRARAANAARIPALRQATRIAASTEQKAQDTAHILAEALSLPLSSHDDMGENDRSATGFLPPEEFEATADAFFAAPSVSTRGWETAEAAQARILAAARPFLEDQSQTTLLIGHGAVGTLLWCALTGLAISRRHDQPGGSGGNLWTFDPAGAISLPWTPIEDLVP